MKSAYLYAKWNSCLHKVEKKICFFFLDDSILRIAIVYWYPTALVIFRMICFSCKVHLYRTRENADVHSCTENKNIQKTKNKNAWTVKNFNILNKSKLRTRSESFSIAPTHYFHASSIFFQPELLYYYKKKKKHCSTEVTNIHTILQKCGENY